MQLGELRADDLEPCLPLTPDAGDTAADALSADASNRGSYIECQQRQAAALGVLRALIRAGRLRVVGH